MLKRQVFEDM